MAAKFGRVLIDCYLNLIGGFNKNIPLLCSLLQCLAIPYEQKFWLELKFGNLAIFADDAKLKYKNRIASYKAVP